MGRVQPIITTTTTATTIIIMIIISIITLLLLLITIIVTLHLRTEKRKTLTTCNMCRCEPGGSERKLVMLVRWRQQVEAVVGAHPSSAGWRAKVWMEKPCEPAGFWREVKANLVVVGGRRSRPPEGHWLGGHGTRTGTC